MSDTLVHDAATRLFGDLATPSLVNAAENGEWPAGLWQAIEEAGFLDALVSHEPGDLAGMVDAASILRAAGRYAVPLPVAETMLGRFAMASAGLTPGSGPLSILPVEHDDALAIRRGKTGWTLSGRARQVPWARQANRLVCFAGEILAQVAPDRVEIRPGANLAGEPRDEVVCEVQLDADEVAQCSVGVGRTLIFRLGALCRAAQMAGALEGALAMAVQYAGDRVQFGRPIGNFQAIQQQLALLAEQVAAAGVAVTAAAAMVAGGGDPFFAAAAAKIRAGEAAGRASDIAHQVHGAIGFTHEHPLHHLTRRLWSWRDEFGIESDWSLELGRHVTARGAEGLWPLLTAP